MTKPASTPNRRLAAPLAVALLALLTCAAPALAYDPATDQYTPSTPSGGGSVPAQGGDDADAGGGGFGGGSDSGAGGGSTPAPATGAAPVTPPGPVAGADAGAVPETRDQRTLRELAAQGEQQRDALADPNGGADAVRPPIDADGDQGMGVLLPIVLALMLAAAIGARFVRRGENGHLA